MKFSDDNLLDADSLDINITPLIDVVFLLLIFFMLTTTFVDSRGLQVKLPEARSEKAPQSKNNIALSLDKHGTIFLNNSQVTLEALPGKLRELAILNKNPLLVLRADTKALHGTAVTLLDIARTQGIERIAIATRPPILTEEKQK